MRHVLLSAFAVTMSFSHTSNALVAAAPKSPARTGEACDPTPAHSNRNDLAQIHRVVTEAAATAADEDAAVQAEIAHGVAECRTDENGNELNLRGVPLLQCLITQFSYAAPEGRAHHYRTHLEPKLRALVLSLNLSTRQLGTHALQLVNQAGAGDRLVKDSLQDMGHYVTYRNMVERQSQAIEMATDPQLRAAEIKRLGLLQRQWETTYQARRDGLAAEGYADEASERHSKTMEAALNGLYKAYENEINQLRTNPNGELAPVAQGRTQFGQPRGVNPAVQPVPRALPPGSVAPGAPNRSAGPVPGPTFHQGVLRAR